MEIDISIIIPAYNVAGYIETCLESMVSQTFQRIEIIVIEDGSTDKTPEICDRFAALDKRITVVHQENAGVSAARNTGISLAKGKYICFFDGDDFIDPDTCGELHQKIEEHGTDALIYGYYRYENGRIKDTCLPVFTPGTYKGDSLRTELLPRFIGFSLQGIDRWLNHEDKALYVENPALWRIMLSRRIIMESGIRFRKELKVGEDTIFISEYLSHAESCCVYPKCYYYLVTRESSTIYQYERNPAGKLEGKLQLLHARCQISNEIKRRTKDDISSSWYGTVVMSVVEMAFLLSKKNPNIHFGRRYQMFLKYAQNREVRKIIMSYYPMYKTRIMALPFFLLRMNLNFMVFLAAALLNLMNFEFNRN